MQIVAGLTLTVAYGFTVIVAVPLFTHPLASVTVTEYVVVAVGLAVGLEMFGLLNPVEGLQV